MLRLLAYAAVLYAEHWGHRSFPEAWPFWPSGGVMFFLIHQHYAASLSHRKTFFFLAGVFAAQMAILSAYTVPLISMLLIAIAHPLSKAGAVFLDRRFISRHSIITGLQGKLPGQVHALIGPLAGLCAASLLIFSPLLTLGEVIAYPGYPIIGGFRSTLLSDILQSATPFLILKAVFNFRHPSSRGTTAGP